MRIVVGLSMEEARVAEWACRQTEATFRAVVKEGHMRGMPPLPELKGAELVVPMNSDVLQELDYQLTIGLQESEDAGLVGVDRTLGTVMARRMNGAVSGRGRIVGRL